MEELGEIDIVGERGEDTRGGKERKKDGRLSPYPAIIGSVTVGSD